MLDAALFVCAPTNLLILALSVASGLVMGVLPGLSATMAIALLMTLTYKIPESSAILALIGVYVGAISGGCQSAILLNIPGTAASAATALDGYPLARRGEGGLGIFAATTASFCGTVVSVAFVLTLTPPLTSLALKFASWEFFLLSIFGILICGALTAKGNAAKGWIGGILGLMTAMVGMDQVDTFPRFSFGNVNVMSNIQLIPVMIGLFGFPEIVRGFRTEKEPEIMEIGGFRIGRGLALMAGNALLVLRSSVIGVVVGIIPGVGEDVGGWLSYWATKSLSKEPETFGRGNILGVISAETGNNACIGGAIIPVLSLAIPGSAPAAVLMAAFFMHGYRPGPLLMSETPDFLYNISVYLVFASVFMWAIALGMSRITVRVLRMNKKILMPVIFILCVVGSYLINYNFFDVKVMFVFGVLGILMSAMDVPAAPFLLGVILGPMMDSNLRRALRLSDGSFWPMLQRPLCLMFLAAILLMILGQAGLFSWLSKKRKRAE